MVDTDQLVQAAAAAAVGALTKAAAEPALSAGRAVWDWLKAKLGGTAAAVAAEVEAGPARPSAAPKVTGLLQDLLHDRPDLAEELRRLLDACGGSRSVKQTANVSGSNSAVGQVAGSGNTVRIGQR